MSPTSRPGASALHRLARTVLAAAALAPAALRAQAAAPAVAALGACRLASGATIPDCRVAYRSYGRPNADRSNVVLVPTFFAGRSEDHAFMLGAYVDTTRFHVIVADALADGHSSSPSNTPAARAAFDALTIGDMVEAHRRLLVEHLGVRRLRAVVGISMGGFQALEWAVRHPGFADAVVSIVGTPRPTAYDRLVYETIAGGAALASRSGASAEDAWTQASRLEALVMRTPRALDDSGSAWVAADVAALARAYREQRWSLDDYAAQMHALARHDVSAPLGGDLAAAARTVRARLLLVHSPDDRMVSAAPSAEFARLAGAETLEVRSACGHALFWCEAGRVGAAVRAFVARDAGITTQSAR